MRSTRQTLAVLALVLLLVAAGCSGSSNSDGGSAASVAEDGGVTVSEQGSGGGGSDGENGEKHAVEGGTDGASVSQLAAQRAIIRTAEVRLEVRDYGASRANLTAAVEARGGYVSASERRVREYGNASWTSGTVVLRVPKEHFDDLLGRIRAEGEVERESMDTADVTDQIVDIEARLENLRAERDRLRTLYERANETEDVLKVQRELSDVQGEIERLTARLRALENRVAYSTITVHLSEPRPDYEPEYDRTHWYDVGVLDALGESIRGVGVVLRAAVVVAAYAAPYLVTFGLPLVGVALFVLRRR